MRIFAFLAFFLTPLAAFAQAAPTLLDSFNAWEAYRFEQNGQVSCYALSKPTALRPTNRKHGDVFFFVTSRPNEEVRNEISFLVGYPFAPDSQVTATVDGQDYTLFTKDDGAWMESTAQEAQLVAAMRAGSRMTVSGTSARGTNTSYDFSLSGITAATNRIAGNCS